MDTRICYKQVMLGSRLTLGFVLLLLPALYSGSAAAADNSCTDCHQDSSFFAQYPKLHEYYQQWLGSPHNQAGVGCEDCHGGDSAAATMQAAHRGVLAMSSKDSTLHFQAQPETCGQCHSNNRQQFVQSKHYAALMSDRAAPTCTTCHPAMSRRPELRKIVVNACRNCHSEDNDLDLPLIADQAEDVFSKLNIAGGLLGWTRIHYESHDWPDDSRQHVRDLETRHAEIISRVHQFDLQQTETATIGLLADLRNIFDEARNAYERQAN
jgi:formate-dependent nitrite reductase cytochrome c552 subunit